MRRRQRKRCQISSDIRRRPGPGCGKYRERNNRGRNGEGVVVVH